MATISSYAFHKSFNLDSLTKRQALEYGISSSQFSAADKNNDSELSISEIMVNDAICDMLLEHIANASKTVKKNETDSTKANTAKPATTTTAQTEKISNIDETAKDENISYEA